MVKFEDFKLSEDLYKSIKRLGFEIPTEIQKRAIDPILKGKDVLGESETGSGKTLAFGCGIVEKVDRKKGLQALIITPTRELAEQVKEELRRYARYKQLKIISIYGGVAIGPQIEGLGIAEVVVATPGRLKDHLQRGTINFSHIKILVLDEADRMLDMGFIDDIEDIIRVCPRKRQTLFFSATILPRVEELAKKYMHKPIKILTRRQVDPSKLKQVYYDIPRNLKLSVLLHLIKNETSKLIMIFCNTRRNTDFVVKNLKVNKIKAVALHGGFTQNKRSKTMVMFNKGERCILVCTDVAARGLHIDDVTHVYNYDIPRDPTDYVHRIGRTARAGEKGKVINILCDTDYENFSKLLQRYSFNIKKIKKPHVERALVRKDDEGRGRFGNRYSHRKFGGRGSNRRSGGRSSNRRYDGESSNKRYGDRSSKKRFGSRRSNSRSGGRSSKKKPNDRRRYNS